ncbi:MAG TPA: hypothetical protein VF595_14500 [Tepidisphaeraceae bacterium]
MIAFAALTATVVAKHVLPDPPQKQQTNLTVKIGKLNLGWNSKEKVPPVAEVRQRTTRKQVRMAGIGLGLVALPFALVSWARRERVWWGLGIVVFAVAAMAWQWFVVVFAVLVLSGALFAFVPTERRSATA